MSKPKLEIRVYASKLGWHVWCILNFNGIHYYSNQKQNTEQKQYKRMSQRMPTVRCEHVKFKKLAPTALVGTRSPRVPRVPLEALSSLGLLCKRSVVAVHHCRSAIAIASLSQPQSPRSQAECNSNSPPLLLPHSFAPSKFFAFFLVLFLFGVLVCFYDSGVRARLH